MSEPQYYIDYISSNKDGGEHHDIYAQVPHINQIQPVLNASHMISSIRQALVDLRDSLIPFSWSHTQHTYNQQDSVNEKMNLPI